MVLQLTGDQENVIRTFGRRWRAVQAALVLYAVIFFAIFLSPAMRRTNPIAGLVTIFAMLVTVVVFAYFVLRCPVCKSAPAGANLTHWPPRCGNCGALLKRPAIANPRFATPFAVALEYQRRERLLGRILSRAAVMGLLTGATLFITYRGNDTFTVVTAILVFAMFILTFVISAFVLHRCPNCRQWPDPARPATEGLSVRFHLTKCHQCGVSFIPFPPPS